jgi:hypothetical protein
MTEPCTRCPPFVVRCGHLGEDAPLQLLDFDTGRDCASEAKYYLVTTRFFSSPTFRSRAEADAEFERMEEALLA